MRAGVFFTLCGAREVKGLGPAWPVRLRQTRKCRGSRRAGESRRDSRAVEGDGGYSPLDRVTSHPTPSRSTPGSNVRGVGG